MTKKKILFGIGIFLLVAMLAILSANSGTPDAAPSSSPTPQATLKKIEASQIPFQIDLPSITSSGRLVFSTYRRTALGSSNLVGKDFKNTTPQQFRYMDDVAWSPDGSRAIIKSLGKTVLFDRGKLRTLNAGIQNAEWAPDNQRFAYTYRDLPHVYDVSAKRFTRLADTKLGNRFAWTPDGDRLATFSDVTDGGALYLISISSKDLVATGEKNVISALWSPNAERLLVTKSVNGSPMLYAYEQATKNKKDLKLPALAEKAAWLSNERFYVAAPETVGPDYLETSEPFNDYLWSVSMEDRERLAELDGIVSALRVSKDRLVLITPTSVYQMGVSR